MKKTSRVIILVKALPQPSKRHGETVCCAGITADCEWKRLYPVRYRHLSGEASFKRWDIVEFDYTDPISDRRKESCRVHEETIQVVGRAKESERIKMLSPLFHGSAEQAAKKGNSLTIIRPKNTKFISKPRTSAQIKAQKEAFEYSAKQTSLFDEDLRILEPSPYDFRFKFADATGTHDYACGDWEVHAMYWNARKRMGDKAALEWMRETFDRIYPKAGMAFALGNMASRPQTWQLLGVVRLDNTLQMEMPL